MLISLDNYEEYEDKYIINSPRSLEACNRGGIDPEELKFISLEDFADNRATLEVLKMRFNHREEKRKMLITQARKERADIIKMLENPEGVKPGSLHRPITQLSGSRNDHSTFGGGRRSEMS